MKTLMMSATCALSLVLTLPASARADEPTAVDHLVAAAQIVRVDALEVRQMLGERDASLIAVLQQVDVLNARATALMSAMTGPAMTAATLTPVQTDALERARAATGAMLALITNKAVILSDVDSAPAKRRLLRDKADGVARRAALIEQQMARLRS